MIKKNILKKIFCFKKKKGKKGKIYLRTYLKNSVKGQNLYLLIFVIVLLGVFIFLRNWFIVATVNYRPITRFTLDRELEKQLGEQILEMKVTEILIQQEAKKQGVRVSKEEINEKIKEIEDQLALQSQNLDDILALQKQTRKDLENDLKNQILAERLVNKNIEISDEEIEAYFNTNKDFYPEGTTSEEKKEEIKEILSQQELNEKFQSWLDNIKKEAKIKYFVTF